MLLERWLNFNKHMPQLLLGFTCNDRGILSINAVHNVRGMLVVLIKLQLLQYLTNLGRFNISNIRDAFLLEFCENRIKDLLGNISALLCLNLCQPLIEVINALVGVVGNLTWRVLIRRLI